MENVEIHHEVVWHNSAGTERRLQFISMIDAHVAFTKLKNGRPKSEFKRAHIERVTTKRERLDFLK